MTVEMVIDGLLKIFFGLVIILVYLRLTHRSQAGHQTPIDTIGNFVIGGLIGGVLYSKQISLFYFLVYLVFTLCMIQLLNVATSKIRFCIWQCVSSVCRSSTTARWTLSASTRTTWCSIRPAW